MSESIRRKNSSKQLLQNLIRVTAQRSQEDAEEVERERRRRSREKERGEGSPSWPEPPQHNDLAHDTELDEELKPTCCLVLEEDEGFSDWSNRLENRNDQEVPDDCRARVQRPSTAQWKPEPKEEKQQKDDDEEEVEEEACETEQSGRSQRVSTRPPEKMSNNRKEVRTSYSSTVFLPQETRLHHGQPADRTSYLVAGTMKPRGGACRVDGEVQQKEQKEEEEVQAARQTEWRSAEIEQSPTDEDDQEEEELRFTHEEKEDVHLSREERYREEKEEEEEHKVTEKRSTEEGQRSEEVNRRSATSRCSSSEGDESLHCYGPMSPTFKKLLIQFYPDEVNSRVSTDGKCTIIERTESLKKSTNSIKKTLPPIAVSKIDKKLEQYTHALEVSSKEGRSSNQVLTDLMNPTEPVSSKKNLFEAGEAWNQNIVSMTPSKDADALKVGVADLINQWVRGSEDGSRCSSPCKPAESSSGKRYKFVVTGHGKYEKVSADSDCSEDANCQPAGQYYEDL
ncbi:lymphocyte-specific protein 1-like isoform X1 [Larimichthys crocea]|uniref:lymphocyte-specific protein 1-like isoform X1 n=1 Tax=Larimichthys crocea TaxID=215358 RepID=UPI00090186A1|nr:lymphocyte-specific protein 1-like isoform X1 [Larimichthys crocea]